MPIQTTSSRLKASMSAMTGMFRNVGESLLSLVLRTCKRPDGAMIDMNGDY
jgi:hypothetical protein